MVLREIVICKLYYPCDMDVSDKVFP